MKRLRNHACPRGVFGARSLSTLLAWLALAGCTPVRHLVRPEGDGGWTPQQRHDAVAAIGPRAGVVVPAAADGSPTAAAPPAEVFDLRRALEQAAASNRALAEADRRLLIGRQRVLEVRGRLLPATTAEGAYTWYTDTRNVSLPADLQPPGAAPASIAITDADAGTIAARVALPLDLSGEIRQSLAAAQAGYRGEAARRWATQLEQDLLVVRAYFRRLEAQRLREVTAQTLAVYRRQLADAEQRFRAGRLTKNEVLEVQVALRNAEQRAVQDDVAIDEARWTFNRVIGVPVDAPTDVTDVRERPDLPAVDDLLRSAQAKNPLLTALFERERQLEAEQSALERSRFPRFNAGGGMDYSSSDLFSPQAIGSGFVGFTWDLGTDTQREARIGAARLAVDENRIQLEAQLRELEQALRALRQATAERLTALDTARVAVEQAEENLRIRRQQFDAGRAETRDVLDAERLLAAERAVLATALYQAHIRRAELQQLMGEPLDALSADRR